MNTTPRLAYRLWRHYVRKSLNYAARYEMGDDRAVTFQTYAAQDAGYWATVLHDLTGVWVEWEST